MKQSLNIGGMVAGGFDDSGKYLLIVSHSGRGVYENGTWLRVARDSSLAYPQAGFSMGIGPLAGMSIKVHEVDYSTGVLELISPDGAISLRYSEGLLEISCP